MTVTVYLSIYAGLVVFVTGCIWRLYDYARLPFHLRWELYPVPHEEPRLAEHGGSYFESRDWWLSSQTVHRRSEWLAMIREIVLLRGVWEFNRPLWLSSFLFHFGLYLSIAAVGLGGLAVVAGVAMTGGALGPVVAGMELTCRLCGLLGTIFVLLGAMLLLEGRLTDPSLKNYTKAGDIFNLLFFIAAFGLLGVGAFEPTTSLAGVLRGALHFDRNVEIAPVAGMGTVLVSALAAYIPFTHMSHFIAKYFTWHSVRWDDRRNARRSALERQVAVSLRHRPTWAARHIGADGNRSWAEVATANPVEEERK